MKIFITSMSLLLATVSLPIMAASDSGYREILSLGCHLNANATCYMTLSGAAVGPSACKTNSVRFNVANDTNGKVVLTQLTSAFLAKRHVSFRISDSCYRYQTNHPTFDWYSIR